MPLLHPVLLYLFCDPNHHDHFGALRAALLARLLELGRAEPAAHRFLLELLPWPRLHHRPCLPEAAALVCSVLALSLELGLGAGRPALGPQLLLLPAVARAQAVHGLHPGAALSLMHRMEEAGVTTDWDAALLLLTEAVREAPHLHHATLLAPCLRLVHGRLVSRLAAGALAAVCLQDLALPSGGEPSTDTKAELVRAFYRMEAGPGPAGDCHQAGGFQLPVSAAQETAALMREFASSPGLAGEWLAAAATEPHTTLGHSAPLLSALLLCASPGEATLALELLLACAKEEPTLAPGLLTLLTHRLGRPGTAPALRLALLRALPSMAADRGCISLLLRIVSSLAPRAAMAPLRLTLLLRLWREESRCWPVLQAALTAPGAGGPGLRLAQAVVVSQVLTTHAARHGSDLLPLLSSLINQAVGEEEAEACSLALQGIAALCREGVTDMRTTVEVLAPKCSVDPRPRVLCSYLALLGLAPSLPAAGPRHAAFLSSSLAWLWSLVGQADPGPGVQEAAYRALAAWPPGSTALRLLPPSARQGLRLPARYCSTPEEAARPAEEVLPYVPGECWAALSTSPGAASLLRALLAGEVLGLPRPLYSQVDPRRILNITLSICLPSASAAKWVSSRHGSLIETVSVNLVS
jgi:hypothetical protein